MRSALHIGLTGWMLLSVAGCGLFVDRLPEGVVLDRTVQDRFVNLDGVKHHYREWPGPGRDIFLQHGFGSSTYTWEWLAPQLNAAGYHVWALDLRGFGWSDKPQDAAYDPRALLADMHHFLDDKGLRDLILIGHSLGGGLAWMTAVERPDLVQRLVLIDAAGYTGSVPAVIHLASWPLADQQMELVFGRWAVRWVLGEVYQQDSLLTDDRVDAYYDRLRTRGMLHAQAELSRSLLDETMHRMSQRIPEVQQPTLILWGAHDIWLPPEQGQRFHQDIAGSRLQVLDCCGHMPQEESPEEVARLILDFLRSTEPVEGLTTSAPASQPSGAEAERP
ncbi:MAG: alpha/beta hydrolase [Pseudomonadota bacterium]